jgi:hypothetical protein
MYSGHDWVGDAGRPEPGKAGAVNENVLRSHKLQRRLKYTNL